MACCKPCCGCANCTEGQQGKCCCGGPSGTCCQSGEYCCSGTCQSEPCSGGACCVEPSSCGDGGSVCLDENGNLDSFNQAWKDEADAKGMNTTVTAYPEIEGLCPEGISGYFGYTCEKAYCFSTFDGSMVPYLCTDDPSGGCLDGVTQEQCETGGGTWHAGKTCAEITNTCTAVYFALGDPAFVEVLNQWRAGDPDPCETAYGGAGWLYAGFGTCQNVSDVGCCGECQFDDRFPPELQSGIVCEENPFP